MQENTVVNILTKRHLRVDELLTTRPCCLLRVAVVLPSPSLPRRLSVHRSFVWSRSLDLLMVTRAEPELVRSRTLQRS